MLEPASLLESIPDFAIIFDTSGSPVAANQAALKFLEKSPDQLRAMSQQDLLDLLQVSEENDQRVELSSSIVARALSGQSVRQKRRLIRRPDNSTVAELSVSASPICDRRGQLVGVLMIAHDLTELAMLQRRVQDAERHYAIGQMAAALAHDFNNVLDTIGQAAAVLEMSKKAKERQDMTQIIRTAVRRGAEIIAAVREYLRTGTGERTSVDIRQVLIETVELTRPLWQRAGVHLITQLRPVRAVNANVADLRRVFTNLVINAIEAMPQGGDLTISCQEEGNKVVAKVSDTGGGITPENQAKIFFPYFTTKIQGTGLGLSAAQKTLLAFGGSVAFRSEPGKSTTFIVELPAQDQNEEKGRDQSAA